MVSALVREVTAASRKFYYLVDLNIQENDRVSADLDDSCYYSLGHVFYDHKVCLAYPNGGSEHCKTPRKVLLRGQHRIPFSMVLPVDLPGSFHFNSCGLHARIFYQLDAEISVSGLLRRNLRSDSCELKLLQFPQADVMPLQIVRELPVASFVCLAQGCLEVAISLDKNIYTPGDLINIKLAIDSSQCFKSIQSVQVSLHRILRFGNPDTSQHRTEFRTLDKCKSTKLRLESRQDGIIYRRTSLRVPPNTPLSLQGRLIECRYELEFKIKADWSWPVATKVRIPVEETFLPSYANTNIPTNRISSEALPIIK